MTMSRRGLLGGGAALAGAGAVAALTERNTKGIAAQLTAVDLEALDIPVMLSVTDASAGTMEIQVGEQAIEFQDRGLVAKLARATRDGGGV